MVSTFDPNPWSKLIWQPKWLIYTLVQRTQQWQFYLDESIGAWRDLCGKPQRVQLFYASPCDVVALRVTKHHQQECRDKNRRVLGPLCWDCIGDPFNAFCHDRKPTNPPDRIHSGRLKAQICTTNHNRQLSMFLTIIYMKTPCSPQFTSYS